MSMNGTAIDAAAQKTAEQCGLVRDTAQHAVEWLKIDKNRNVVGQRHELLLRQMRFSARQAERLKNAATSPVSIAVYGASQAGKSFLVAHLAAPPVTAAGAAERSAYVLPHAQDGGIPFLAINPTGGRESTGLVTRFTTRPVSGDRQFPVHLRLLTAFELTKILASCYFVDMEQSEEGELDAQEMESLLAGLRSSRGTVALGLTGDDIYELKDFCQRWIHLRNNIKTFNSAQYWERLAADVEHLALDDLTRVLELLWGKVPAFTATFRKLHGGLQQLGFATEVQCGLDALLPRVDKDNPDRALTIIDVDTLKRLLSATPEPLQVRHRGGVSVLDRPVVTALAAELVLNLHGATRPFLQRIDLLDFPGARNRGGLKRGKLEEKGEPESVFLRGKVALLFERYRDDYDLTSMILCVGPSAQEVGTLPKLINEWVEAMHGDTPEKRRSAETALFVVLTKFDGQFVRQTGEETAIADRWNNRIKATIGDFLARDGNWTRDWHPGVPFNNVFWYRNPFVRQTHIMDYAGAEQDAPETGVRADMEPYVAEMRSHYDQVDLVLKHFREPGKAWDAVFALNDGGISYLADAIAAISSRNVKDGQIRARVASMAQGMRAELQQYFFDEDPNSQLKARKAKSDQLLREIGECYERGRFGRLLHELQIEQDELAQIYRSVRLREGLLNGASRSSVPANGRRSIVDIALGRGQEQTGPIVLDCTDIDNRRAEIEERFACRAVSRWVERIDATCHDEDKLNYFGLSQDGAQTLASELVAGIRRCNIAGNVATNVRDYASFPVAGLDLGASSPALVAATIVNEFVNDLQATLAGGTAWGGGAGAAGEERDAPMLGETTQFFDQEFCMSWIRHFDAFVGENAQSPEGKTFDVEQNAAMGRILRNIAALT